MPFNIRTHRTLKYHFNASNPVEKAKKDLEDKCFIALRSILNFSNIEGIEKLTSSDDSKKAEGIRRERDIKAIDKFFRSIYIPTIYQFWELAQYDIIDRNILTLYDSLASVVLAINFHLHDKRLEEIIQLFSI